MIWGFPKMRGTFYRAHIGTLAPPILENQMEKKMETGIIRGIMRIRVS